jgi:hypothetical protein
MSESASGSPSLRVAHLMGVCFDLTLRIGKRIINGGVEIFTRDPVIGIASDIESRAGNSDFDANGVVASVVLSAMRRIERHVAADDPIIEALELLHALRHTLVNGLRRSDRKTKRDLKGNVHDEDHSRAERTPAHLQGPDSR